jgi:hypothetical protein
MSNAANKDWGESQFKRHILDRTLAIAKRMVAHDLSVGSAPTENPFTSYTVDELRDRPEPGWHIDGVLPVGIDTMLYGPAYSGKTLVVLDMLLSMANGVPWMGHDTGEPADVALVVGEGQRGITRRIDAWLVAHPNCSDKRLAIVPAMPNIRSVPEVT